MCGRLAENRCLAISTILMRVATGVLIVHVLCVLVHVIANELSYRPEITTFAAFREEFLTLSQWKRSTEVCLGCIYLRYLQPV